MIEANELYELQWHFSENAAGKIIEIYLLAGKEPIS